MPIFEFTCKNCKKKFEDLIQSKSTKVACPFCESNKVEKLFSVFGMMSGASNDGISSHSSSGCSSCSSSSCSTCK